ncbi:MAG: right-handed parallel beta-helix repeat-containing protein [Actinomycetota bacterium]|nr:right-handed parallel beta-helix repeat-containing protein [Actinomycetota bacterium]MDP9460294.1 right-handed parallel beta-helix repeat-containing protein [Actinomycetota bacterium]
MKSRVLSLAAAVAISLSGALTTVAATPASAATTSASLVPTFSSVGVYWSPAGGAASKPVTVAHRALGQAAWTKGQDLWFDGRALAGRPAEYRGSIVGLAAGTTYEVQLALPGTTPTIVTQQVRTWAEKFPVATTVELPATSSKPLDLSRTGSPTGYVLVTGPGGGPATIDVAGAADHAVRLTNSSYVILRGLTLKGAKRHGIQLGASTTDDVHDIVLERNTISGWGTPDTSGFGTNLDSAVYSDSEKLTRVVIQGNTIRSPRTTSNSWKELHNGSYHPQGPQGITLRRGLGNNVIRYNDVVGDATHRFNDGMGATANFGYNGFPGKDSDIHGNHVAYAWDDGIEAEGGGMNVRIWQNYQTEIRHSFGMAAVSLGPTYAWRNVQDVSRGDSAATWGQAMFKMGGKTSGTTFYGDGRVYVFHNTVLKPLAGPQTRKPFQAADGRVLRNAVTRNNIFQTGAPSGTESIDDEGRSSTNSFDHDLYNGTLFTAAGAEARGVKGAPAHVSGWGFDPVTRTGAFALAAGSPGLDQGAPLAGFNPGFTGTAPDMGAHEAGAPRMAFGALAFRAP